MSDEEKVQAYYRLMKQRQQYQAKPKVMNIIQTNIDKLVESQCEFIAGSYEQFIAFGGPCVYFHSECLAEGRKDFLSKRHVELLYATLTAWGMHRMGDSERTKTKLSEWDRFSESLQRNRDALEGIRHKSMSKMSTDQYTHSLHEIKELYFDLDLTMSDSTLVVNSKPLFHLCPEYIPPIDRQYTIRFLLKRPDQWMTPEKKFRTITLPQGKTNQFKWFKQTCIAFKNILDRINSNYFEDERQRHQIAHPKIIDNAIVHYVRKISGKFGDMA